MIVVEVIDGKVIERELTQEEIEEYNKQQVQTTQEPTLEERIASIEDLLLNLL